MSIQPEPFLPVEEAPSYGDIVWGRFPEELGKPGPKHRPVLVLATAINENYDPRYASVQCAYGTSNMKRDRDFARFHLTISNVLALNKFRLPQNTRFDLDQIVWLPWSSRYFAPRAGQNTPVIGKLDDDYLRRLEVLKQVRAVMPN